MMSELIQQNMSEIIAGLALILSLSANLIAEKARKTAARVEERSNIISKAEKRTESLVEIELQNAAIGNMLLVLAQKVLLFQQYPDLYNKNSQEYERLTNNLNLMQDLQKKNDYQRKIAEEALEADSIASHEKALADVRRLRFCLENEVKKETQAYEKMLQELKDASV